MTKQTTIQRIDLNDRVLAETPQGSKPGTIERIEQTPEGDLFEVQCDDGYVAYNRRRHLTPLQQGSGDAVEQQ